MERVLKPKKNYRKNGKKARKAAMEAAKKSAWLGETDGQKIWEGRNAPPILSHYLIFCIYCVFIEFFFDQW